LVRRALRDRGQILSYWNNRNKSNLYSQKLDKLFTETIKAILKIPSLERNTSIDRVKQIIARNYLIIYQEVELSIIVLRIGDSRQNPARLTFKI